MLPPKNLISLLLVLSLLLSPLTGPPKTLARTSERLPAPNGNNDGEDSATEPTGLRFRLSPGVDQPESRPTTNVAPATELSASDTESILKRLPPIKTEGNDEQEFTLRERSLPPPRTGQTAATIIRHTAGLPVSCE